MGVACEVVAPSLIPKGSSDRVKTDKRDAIRLARLHRAGALTAIRVPTPAEEAVRDPVRARADVLDDRKRMQQRLTAVLLRHGRVWRGGGKWTLTHRAWIARQVFDEPALTRVVATYRGGLAAREAELAAVDAELAAWAAAPPLASTISKLGAYRGIAALTAMTLATEVVDWRRFSTARAFMGFSGLIPSEYSSGDRSRRGQITKAGPVAVRTALIEAAWAYHHRPGIGVTLSRRQAGVGPQTLARSWTAQQRLCAKYTKMIAHGKPPAVAVVAIARELAGFVWAEMTAP
jgi:transposase